MGKRRKKQKNELNTDDYYPVTCYVSTDLYDDYIEVIDGKICKIGSMRMDRNENGNITVHYNWEVKGEEQSEKEDT